MNTTNPKYTIQHSLTQFSQGSLRKNALALLNTLGYQSERQVELSSNTFAGLAAIHPPMNQVRKDKALVDHWLSVDILFQLTGAELRQSHQLSLNFEDVRQVDNQIIESYLFMAIRLSEAEYSRSRLAEITREVNKCFAMPVMILFQYGEKITISIIHRRLNRRDESRDVLEKVTLIKDISISNPHRGHVEILYDLSLEQLAQKNPVTNFVQLHQAWEKTLDTAELNKKFYREVANWYFWAVKVVEFPEGAGADREQRNAISVIRLITRLIFVWFIKEKGLVPDDLFDERRLSALIHGLDEPDQSTYYKAILQNLFFATLNTEMNSGRRFRGKNHSGGLDSHHGITTVYRYQNLFKDSNAAGALFAGIPFLNGGLFECLDQREPGKDIFVDGFSDTVRNQPSVPNKLFFSQDQVENLNEAYGDTRHSRERVRGLIEIFKSYKFTIEENTPIEEEIALDPELLGRVFENLLAAYNPETKTTARKQTGSYYTPREIVNYMVDEALIAYLAGKLEGSENTEERLRCLLDYNNETNPFNEQESAALISAMDAIKVLDPACGSGAFPMGVLLKLVFILNKLDPGNQFWKQRQLDRAAEIPDVTARESAMQAIEQAFAENELDYGRKLYLIENCIYGVDIQPIAVQIAKLRFFISLVVDQTMNAGQENLGIRPLPNLETKFVAANTLIGIDRPENQSQVQQVPEVDEEVQQACNLLVRLLEQYLMSRTPSLKDKYLAEARQQAEFLNRKLRNRADFEPLAVDWIFQTARDTSGLKALLPLKPEKKATALVLRNPEIEENERNLAQVRREHFSARTSEKKHKCRERDRALRANIAALLNKDGWGGATAAQLASWDPYNQNASAGFFDPEWMFGIVNGFDIVIGNPPYGAEIKSDLLKIIMGRVKDTTNSNSAAIFIDISKNIFVNNNGIVTLIVPKSLLFSEDWFSLVKTLSQHTSLIVDVEKAFNNVLLEQVFFVFNWQFNQSHYLSTRFLDGGLLPLCKISTSVINQYKAWICGVNDRELVIGRKILECGTHMKDISQTKRGLPIQNKLQSGGVIPFYGGKNIIRYGTNGIKGYLPNINIVSGEKTSFFCQPKVMSQNIVAHVQNPHPHLMIISTPDIKGLMLSVDTISNTVIYNSDYSPLFITALFNSRLINWYVYKFIYCLAIRTMHFDDYYVGKIPIPRIPCKEQLEILDIVQKIIQQKIIDPKFDVSDMESEIDQLVYQLYGLTEEEIAIVEGREILPDENIVNPGDGEEETIPVPIEEANHPIIPPSDHSLYKCGLCGKLVNGFTKDEHAREVHPGKTVEWKKIRKPEG